MAGYYLDLSVFNADPSTLDWQAYKAWSDSSDGISRVALRSSYGSIGTDNHYYQYLAGARLAGISQVIHYHYAYPQYNSPQAEAAWQQQVITDFKPNDLIMLDYEEDNQSSTSEWALEFLQVQQQHFGSNNVVLYSYSDFISRHLQDVRLAAYPLVYALWVPDYPAAPYPWTSLGAWQYTDRLSGVPGIPGIADSNYNNSLPYPDGGNSMGVPAGWSDDGTNLMPPNFVSANNGPKVVLGFRDFVLSHSWDPNNYPLENEHGQNPLEVGNSSLGSGTQQAFRSAILEWNPQIGIVPMWTGQEVLALRQALNTALSQLQSQPASPQLQSAINTAAGALAPFVK